MLSTCCFKMPKLFNLLMVIQKHATRYQFHIACRWIWLGAPQANKLMLKLPSLQQELSLINYLIIYN